MTVRVNGKDTNLPEEVSSVSDLLQHYQLDNKNVIVELNQKIIAKPEYSGTSVQAGDRLELVHFVGGG